MNPFSKKMGKTHGASFGTGGRVDFTKLTTQTPGPNAYSVNTVKKQSFSNKNHSMGTGRIEGKELTVAPPPGQYVIPSSFSQKTIAHHFEKQPRFQVQKNDLPGPSDYNANSPQKLSYCKSSCSMGTGRIEMKEKDVIPPPGSYQLPSAFDKAAQKSQGKQSVQERFVVPKNNIPGPGEYQIY